MFGFYVLSHTLSNVVDDNGDPHFDKISTHVNKLDEEIRHIAQSLLAACQNPQGNDKCERAFSIHKCWKTTDPKVIIIYCYYTSFCFIDIGIFTEIFLIFFQNISESILWKISALLHCLNGSVQSLWDERNKRFYHLDK